MNFFRILKLENNMISEHPVAYSIKETGTDRWESTFSTDFGSLVLVTSGVGAKEKSEIEWTRKGGKLASEKYPYSIWKKADLDSFFKKFQIKDQDRFAPKVLLYPLMDKIDPLLAN